MSKNDEYRANAAECERMAKVAQPSRQAKLARDGEALVRHDQGRACGKMTTEGGDGGHSGSSQKKSPARICGAEDRRTGQEKSQSTNPATVIKFPLRLPSTKIGPD
jgi:hypothetical protein